MRQIMLYCCDLWIQQIKQKCCEQPAQKSNNFTLNPKNKYVFTLAKLRPREHVWHRMLCTDLLTKISNAE